MKKLEEKEAERFAPNSCLLRVGSQVYPVYVSIARGWTLEGGDAAARATKASPSSFS
jgi:hypothetical protein